jgi:hypothetical protein
MAGIHQGVAKQPRDFGSILQIARRFRRSGSCFGAAGPVVPTALRGLIFVHAFSLGPGPDRIAFILHRIANPAEKRR